MFSSFLGDLLGRDALDSASFFSDLPVLTTPRLILRPMRMRDAKDIYAFSSDPEVARHVLWDAHTSLSESRAYLRFIRRQYRLGLPSSWGIVLKETGRVIGTIGLMMYNEEHRQAEVGYSLSRDWWHQGLATEALSAVMTCCFDRLHLHRIEAMHDVANPASGAVMRKCGMVQEGILRGKVYNKGAFVDVALWAAVQPTKE